MEVHQKLVDLLDPALVVVAAAFCLLLAMDAVAIAYG